MQLPPCVVRRNDCKTVRWYIAACFFGWGGVGRRVICYTTAVCRYNAVEFITMIHSQWQNIDQPLVLQKTSHILPSGVSYVVSVVRILEEIDDIIKSVYKKNILICHFIVDYLLIWYDTNMIYVKHQRDESRGKFHQYMSWIAPRNYVTKDKNVTCESTPKASMIYQYILVAFCLQFLLSVCTG